MTPEQLVALDAMRSAWPEEVVRAMLAAPKMLDALCVVALEFGRDIDIDERQLFGLMDASLREAHGRGVWESQAVGAEIEARIEHEHHEESERQRREDIEADAHKKPQPQDRQFSVAEALARCDHCGGYPCWCDSFPGHGAG